MAPTSKGKVCAVIITYYPDFVLLRQELELLCPQVSSTVIIDNTSDEKTESLLKNLSASCEVVSLNGNKGIALAHNVGIKRAKELGCSHVVIMDQDSVPDSDMVAKLVRAEQMLKESGCTPAAMAPLVYDSRYSKTYPFIRREGMKILRLGCTGDPEEVVRADYVISSGCLISLQAFDEIGDMDEDLFIDYVDIEWGLRARDLGYCCYGVCGARLEHNLGDEAAWLPLVNGYVPIRSPLRHYYMFRNAIRLYRRPHIPKLWAVNDAYRLVLKFLYYSLVTPPRFQHLKMMLLGVFDGLKDVGGECPHIK